jgi:hypothetical protein
VQLRSQRWIATGQQLVHVPAVPRGVLEHAARLLGTYLHDIQRPAPHQGLHGEDWVLKRPWQASRYQLPRHTAYTCILFCPDPLGLLLVPARC